MFTVDLYSHQFTPVRHSVDLRPKRYRWAAVGGPETCEIEGACAADDAEDALNWLRYWVIVRNPDGDPVWWGYVEDVIISRGDTALGKSMRSIANKVAVLYSYKDVEGELQQGLTDWAEDAWSQGRYGLHELRSPATDILPSAADVRRDLVLEERAAPIRTVERGGSATVHLVCRGLWRCFENEYYANPAGYAGNDVSSDAEIAVGWQLQDTTIGFHQEYVLDMERRIHTLPNGSQFKIAGAVNSQNNGTFVVSGAMEPEAGSYTADTIFFQPQDDVYDVDGQGLGIFLADNLIEISGSVGNSDHFFIAQTDDAGHFETRSEGRDLVTESAGPTITIDQGSGLKVEDDSFALELPDANVTLTAFGLKVRTDFTVTGNWSIYEVAIEVAKVGSPSDNLLIKFYDDSGGSPGSLQATATLTNGDAPSSRTRLSLDLDSPMAVLDGYTYHVQIERSGSYDPENYWLLGLDEDLSGGGVLYVWDGTDWHLRSPDADLVFVLWGNKETTAQIADIFDSTAQMTVSEIVWSSSNVYTREYREGDRRALAELEDLIALGTSANKRLVATVTPTRSVLVEQASDPSYLDWIWTTDHQLVTPQGVPVDTGRLPAGQWVTDAATGDPMFVQAAEYDVDSGRIDIEIAEDRSPWDG